MNELTVAPWPAHMDDIQKLQDQIDDLKKFYRAFLIGSLILNAVLLITLFAIIATA